MGNIFTDIATAVKVTGTIREARKAGADAVRVKPIRIMPVAALPLGFLDVMEGCSAWNLGKELYQPVKEVLKTVPTRHGGGWNIPQKIRANGWNAPDSGSSSYAPFCRRKCIIPSW